jgi:type I restriction enzyme S subunit
MTSVFRDIPIERLCTKVTTGATPLRSRSDYYEEGTIDWYKTGELKDWYLCPAAERITEKALEETSAKLFPADTVLMAMYGDGRTITSLGMLRAPAATNQACSAMLVDKGKCDTRYFFYALKSRRHLLLKVASGGAQRNLSGRLIKEFTLPVPPLSVQRRIAGVLSAYDELMENSQRRIQILEAMARTLYREWFVHFRFPGHEKFPRVASPLGDIPQGWEVVSLDDVCERVTDGSHSSPESVEDGLPMASSKDMHDWGLTLETCRFIGREDFDQLVRNGSKPKKNDVLITKDGANYLKYIFVNRMEQELVLLSSIAILRPNTHINPHLLAAILKSPENKGRLKNYVTGAAIPRIVLKDFKRFQFVLPSKTVQTQWVKVAEPLTELCWRLVDQIQNLRRTRDLLLPRLLSGELTLDKVKSSKSS